MITRQNVMSVLNGNMNEFSQHIGNDGLSYFETPNEITAVYNTNRYPYTAFQEEGFRNRGGRMVTKHKGFISVKAVGKINNLIYNDSRGITQNNNNLIKDNTKTLKQLGVVRDV